MGSAQYLQLFGELPDLDTTVRCSQFVQAEGLRYANQSMRRHKWHRSACTSWTYNEPWPNAAHGCVVEYFGRPKMAYYYVKQSYAALDISAVYPSLLVAPGKLFRVPVFVSSDLAFELPGYASRYYIYNTAGDRLAEETSNLKILPENSTKAMEVTWAPPARLNGEVVLLYLELKDPQGAVVARNLYTFGVGEPVGENGSIPPDSALLRGLLRAPATRVRLGADRGREVDQQGGRFAIEVENVGPHPALFVTLEADAADGVLFCFEDNYLFLVPGERRKVSVSLHSHVGKTPRFLPAGIIRAKAWNSGQVYEQP
jgi:beta-mannosidase